MLKVTIPVGFMESTPVFKDISPRNKRRPARLSDTLHAVVWQYSASIGLAVTSLELTIYLTLKAIKPKRPPNRLRKIP